MSQAVSVRVEPLELQTYVSGGDSPLSCFGWAHRRPVYPYTAKQDLSSSSRPVTWTSVVLENRLVKVVVLPEIGGHIYRFYDKLNKQDVFMTTPSIKYQNIGPRGEWIAGGIEFNFGRRGHTVKTTDPVDFTVRQEDDGSASVWVGSSILPVESRWAVRISLSPERSALDLDILTMAPQMLPGMMYYWTNSAVQVGQQSRFYYFGLAAHSGWGTHSWPVTNGQDYRWYRNRKVGADMFLMQPQRDYMAFYDFDRHAGLVQWADRFKAPGQKYFTWGNDDLGRYWDKLLSDSGQTYVEMQRGRLPTQGMAERMEPQSVECWNEVWMPLYGTGGFSGADTASEIAVSVAPDGDGAAIIKLQSARRHEKLQAVALAGSKEIDRWTIDALDPAVAHERKVKTPTGATCDGVKVTGADGAVLLDWHEFQFRDEDWFRESHQRFDADHADVDQLFAEAHKVRFQQWPIDQGHAVNLYNRVLAKNPNHVGALLALAEIALYEGQYGQAAERLDKALAAEPASATALCLRGWVYLRTGNTAAAIDAFRAGSAGPERRAWGLMSLASTYLAAGNLPASEAAVDELLGEFPTDRWGSLLAVMVHRKLGRIDAAKELLECLLLADPLWGRLRSEAMLLDMPAEMGGGKRHLSDDAVTSALPYLELGQWADAARILAVPESNDGFGDALRLSHLAYALHRAGDPAGAQKALAAITPQSIQSAHPWSAVSMDALTELARLYPACGPVEAMRGNYLAFNNQIDVAAAAWKKAVELGVKHTAVYGNLAAAAAAKHQIDEAIGYYQQAWDLSDGDLHLLSEFDRLLATAKRNDQREALYKQLPPAKQARPFAAARRVVQLMDTCRYEEALREMETHEFYSAEGERTIHVQYMETLLALALPKIAAGDYAAARTLLLRAVEYPRNLNIGRRLGGSGESIVRYYLGLTESLAGNTAQAREHLLAAAHENHFDGEFTQAFELLAWKGLGECFRTIGLSRRIEAIAAKRPTNTGWVEEWWWQTGPLQTAALGLVQLAKGRPAEAKKIWADVLAKDPATRWVRLLVDTPDAMLKQMMDLNVAVR